MRPETLPLITDYKREWKFIWMLTLDETAGFLKAKKLVAKYQSLRVAFNSFQAIVGNPIFSGYVCQLAETVNLPDDEFEIEQVSQGPVVYQMPKRVKLNDISVTYLDDSLESVYNFHKAWFNAIRCGKETGINSPSLFAATARYIPFEDTMTATEYVILRNDVSKKINEVATLGGLLPEIPLNAKPTSITTYPTIYPTKISRSAANHSGDGLAKVTVNYARIPWFEVSHSPLQKYNGKKWVDYWDDESNI